MCYTEILTEQMCEYRSFENCGAQRWRVQTATDGKLDELIPIQ